MRLSSSSTEGPIGRAATRYPLADDLRTPAGRVAMPRLPRLHAPGGTVHVVGRCNDRAFCFTTPDDFGVLVESLGEMART